MGRWWILCTVAVAIPIACGGSDDDVAFGYAGDAGPDTGGGGASACPAEITTRAGAFADAAEIQAAVAGDIKAELSAACHAIANDLGATTLPTPGRTISDDDLISLCDQAAWSIDAQVQGGASITLAVDGDECTIDAASQFACEAGCIQDSACDLGTVEARCPPDALSASSAEPACTALLDPPACEMNADCAGICQALGAFGSTCATPSVLVQLAGGNAALQATLEANLPSVLRVYALVELVLEGSASLAGAGSAVVSAMAGDPDCLALGSTLQAAVASAADSSASLQTAAQGSQEVLASTSF